MKYSNISRVQQVAVLTYLQNTITPCPRIPALAKVVAELNPVINTTGGNLSIDAITLRSIEEILKHQKAV